MKAKDFLEFLISKYFKNEAKLEVFKDGDDLDTKFKKINKFIKLCRPEKHDKKESHEKLLFNEILIKLTKIHEMLKNL